MACTVCRRLPLGPLDALLGVPSGGKDIWAEYIIRADDASEQQSVFTEHETVEVNAFNEHSTSIDDDYLIEDDLWEPERSANLYFEPSIHDVWEQEVEYQWDEPVVSINETISRLWYRLRRRVNVTRTPRNRTRLSRRSNATIPKIRNDTRVIRRVINRTMSPTRDHSYVAPDIRNLTELRAEAEICAKRKNDPLKRADCGLGYMKPAPQNGTVNWRVFFIGEDWTPDSPIRKFSGCPKRCPLSPRCAVFFDTEFSIHGTERADVVVAPSYNYLSLKRDAHPNAKHRVVYWREASWSGPPIQFMRSQYFSFEMGVHLQAGLRNPALTPPPQVILRPLPELQALEQTYFVASVISDCGAKSKRDDYVVALSDALGPGRRVHRYGKCGGRTLPGESLREGLKRLARYKFYLAFENTIQDGYLTEKLFAAMMLPRTIPVYYGAQHRMFNITKPPSYIRATDFDSPKSLAAELIRISLDESRFKSYLKWKQSKNPFTEEFLESTAKAVPGPEEVLAHGGSMRSALCCRLCNPEFVEAATNTKPKSLMLVDVPLTVEQITAQYFK